MSKAYPTPESLLQAIEAARKSNEYIPVNRAGRWLNIGGSGKKFAEKDKEGNLIGDKFMYLEPYRIAGNIDKIEETLRFLGLSDAEVRDALTQGYTRENTQAGQYLRDKYQTELKEHARSDKAEAKRSSAMKGIESKTEKASRIKKVEKETVEQLEKPRPTPRRTVKKATVTIQAEPEIKPPVRAASPRVASPRVASPRVASPRVASPRAASPRSPIQRSPPRAPSGPSAPRIPSPKITAPIKRPVQAVAGSSAKAPYQGKFQGPAQSPRETLVRTPIRITTRVPMAVQLSSIRLPPPKR